MKQGGQRRRAGPGVLRASPQRRSCLGCSGGNERVLPPAFPPPLPGEKGARPLRGDERKRAGTPGWAGAGQLEGTGRRLRGGSFLWFSHGADALPKQRG